MSHAGPVKPGGEAQAGGVSVSQYAAASPTVAAGPAPQAAAPVADAAKHASQAAVTATPAVEDPWKSAAWMPASAWIEIASTYEDVMRAIDAAFSARPRGSIAAAMPKPVSAIPDLEALRFTLDERVDLLEKRLGETFGGAIAEVCTRPLGYFFNEQVELRLTAIAGQGDAFLDWPQPEHTDVGGEAFYAEVNKLLVTDNRSLSPVVVGVYLFCLNAGFKGRYCDKADAPKIKDLEERLEKKLTCADKVERAAPKAVTPAPRLATMLAIAGVSLVAFQIVLLAISRAM